MHAKLTQAIARESEAAPRDYDIADTLIPGFELRIRRSGAKVWTYRYRTPDGRQRRYVVGRFPGLGASAARAHGCRRRRQRHRRAGTQARGACGTSSGAAQHAQELSFRAVRALGHHALEVCRISDRPGQVGLCRLDG